FVPNDRIHLPYRSLYRETETRTIPARQFLPHRPYGFRKIAGRERRPQLLHCATALDDGAVPHFQSLFEFILCCPWRHHLVDCLEAQHESLNGLQQIIVQLARDTHTLIQAGLAGDLKLLLELPDTESVRRPQQHKRNGRANGPKPIRLVVRRSDGKIQLGSPTVPDAVTIACDHAKGIIPGRKVRVESLPAGAGVVPITVIAVDAVTESYLLWNQKAG